MYLQKAVKFISLNVIDLCTVFNRIHVEKDMQSDVFHSVSVLHNFPTYLESGWYKCFRKSESYEHELACDDILVSSAPGFN